MFLSSVPLKPCGRSWNGNKTDVVTAHVIFLNKSAVAKGDWTEIKRQQTYLLLCHPFSPLEWSQAGHLNFLCFSNLICKIRLFDSINSPIVICARDMIPSECCQGWPHPWHLLFDPASLHLRDGKTVKGVGKRSGTWHEDYAGLKSAIKMGTAADFPSFLVPSGPGSHSDLWEAQRKVSRAEGHSRPTTRCPPVCSVWNGKGNPRELSHVAHNVPSQSGVGGRQEEGTKGERTQQMLMP